MSLIDVFNRKWYRRLLVILLGLGLGFAYFIDRDLNPWGPFFATGYLIGFLSDRVLTCLINLLICLFSVIAIVLVFYIAGGLGEGSPIDPEILKSLTAILFISRSKLAWVMIPGIVTGQLVRFLVLRRLGRR